MWPTDDQGDFFLLCLDHLSACDLKSLFLHRGGVSTINIFFLYFLVLVVVTLAHITNKLPNSAFPPNTSLLTYTPNHSVRGGLLLHAVIQGPKLMEALPSSTWGYQGLPRYHQLPGGYSVEEGIYTGRVCRSPGSGINLFLLRAVGQNSVT